MARKTFSGWKRGRVVRRKKAAERKRRVRARDVGFDGEWGGVGGRAERLR